MKASEFNDYDFLEFAPELVVLLGDSYTQVEKDEFSQNHATIVGEMKSHDIFMQVHKIDLENDVIVVYTNASPDFLRLPAVWLTIKPMWRI